MAIIELCVYPNDEEKYLECIVQIMVNASQRAVRHDISS